MDLSVEQTRLGWCPARRPPRCFGFSSVRVQMGEDLLDHHRIFDTAMLLHSSTVCALTGVETRFADLAGDMLDTLAARRGQTLSDHDRADILGGFASLPPHPDGMPALQRLRSAGYRTVAVTTPRSIW